MEKRKPHYPLSRVKALVSEGHYRITATARRSAYEDFLLIDEGILECVTGLDNASFYKSMTTLFDSALWQDVYHTAIGAKTAYVKLQILDEETVVISFKEK
ncbi:MAG: type II toxin-antitoxin system MqsR family toxin [Spirochaetes bacterium]|nr:type II toxin-antitoxin system MqsR family toxin [Spirochaetota bacterium]